MTVSLGPLGLLADKIDKKVLTKLKDIEAFDLYRIRMSYIAENPESSPHARLLERELKRFLSLNILVKSPKYDTFVPSEYLDKFWHVFILHTKLYRDFCDSFIGGYVDHNPPDDGGRKQGLAIYSGELFSYTQQELTNYFGNLPPLIWGVTARCDTAAPCMSWPSPHI
ncbi:hypothetical protein YU52_000791 [Salmonella enterica subsp. enterica serovar Java]|nr:hypothetical protein [Salmonella enterica subsp. enterica serovar Java]